MTEEATCRQLDRRAALTEAKKSGLRATQLQNAFLPPNAGVKPPRNGVATACSVAQSTLLTPRCGVGLNELLGGGGCRYAPSPDALAENRSPDARARPANFPPAVTEATASGANKPTASQSPLPKTANATLRSVSAPDEPDRRKTRRVVSEEQHQPKPMSDSGEPQNYKQLFCRLTPELSRPAAGWRTRASVAQARGRRHDAGSA